MRNLFFAFVVGFLTHYGLDFYMDSGVKSQKSKIESLGENIKIKSENPDQDPESIDEPKPEVSNSGSDTQKTNDQLQNIDLAKCGTVVNSRDDVAQTSPVDKNIIAKNNKILSRIKNQILERKVIDLELEDYKKFSDKVLLDPALSIARSSEISSFKDIQILNGQWNGQIYMYDNPTKEIRVSKGTIEISFKPRGEQPVGKYNIEFENYGASSGEGNPAGFSFNPNTSDYFIKFGGSYVMHVIRLDTELNANIYRNNQLSGFAKLNRVR